MLNGEFPIWVNILLLLIGLAIMTKGADKFVDSAVVIAERTRVPKAIIGATIVSLGTTLPEFSVSLMAGFFNRPQTTMGDTIGSTICNIGLILGTCLLIRPVVVHRKFHLQQGAIMLLAGVVIMLLSIDGYLSSWDALILTAGLAGYIYYSIGAVRTGRKNVKDRVADIEQTIETVAAPAYSLKRAVAWFTLGTACVVVGATLIVQNAVVIAHWLGITELVISLTVVALGTSLPEYVTGITATIKGHGEIVVGNMIGANILDIFWVRGAGSLGFSLLPVERQIMVFDYPVMLTLMILLLVFCVTGKQLTRWKGGVLLAIYAIYLALMFLLFA
ncbi:calcium/sodium antiporter [Chloroflexota bacterium]